MAPYEDWNKQEDEEDDELYDSSVREQSRGMQTPTLNRGLLSSSMDKGTSSSSA